jgi:hypothetical protein
MITPYNYILHIVYNIITNITFCMLHLNNPEAYNVMGCFRVIKNSVQFHKECSILSPKHKITKNESKMDFCTRFQKILSVFFNYFDFLVKLKPNEKAI